MQVNSFTSANSDNSVSPSGKIYITTSSTGFHPVLIYVSPLENNSLGRIYVVFFCRENLLYTKKFEYLISCFIVNSEKIVRWY